MEEADLSVEEGNLKEAIAGYRDAIKAERMYVDWDGIFDDECCRVCLRAITARAGSVT